MPGQHKQPPITFRPSDSLREQLTQRAQQENRSVSAILTDALTQYLGGNTTQAGGNTTRRVRQIKQDAPRDRTGQICAHPPARRLKGLCMACGTST